jgi:Asp-tRNA(Asn)/Glu-tRNA(Gln) amidotransferase A subunit family amidase
LTNRIWNLSELAYPQQVNLFSSWYSIKFPQEYFPTELESQIRSNFRKVLKTLAEAGAQLIPISLPSTQYALSSYYVISSAESSSNLARYNGSNYGNALSPIYSRYSYAL